MKRAAGPTPHSRYPRRFPMALSFRIAALASVVALVTVVALPLAADEPKPDAPKPAAADAQKPVEGKPIDLVLCLDVSGSMNGLIDSAKLRLWDIVNELARLKPTPKLRVALYSYGATNYPADKGWVRKEGDLTEDLDDGYKMRKALRTGGGTDDVARVTKTA